MASYTPSTVQWRTGRPSLSGLSFTLQPMASATTARSGAYYSRPAGSRLLRPSRAGPYTGGVLGVTCNPPLKLMIFIDEMYVGNFGPTVHTSNKIRNAGIRGAGGYVGIIQTAIFIPP